MRHREVARDFRALGDVVHHHRADSYLRMIADLDEFDTDEHAPSQQRDPILALPAIITFADTVVRRRCRNHGPRVVRLPMPTSSAMVVQLLKFTAPTTTEPGWITHPRPIRTPPKWGRF